MKSFAHLPRKSLLAAAALLALALPARAAVPRDELLRFVPDDVGFCFLMQDLRLHASQLADSPFVEQVRHSPLAAAVMASKELAQLDKADHDLRSSLGVGFDRIRDDLLGDAVVFAYRPGPPDHPDQEQGLILVRARNAEILTSLVDKVNAAQKKDGTLTDLQAVEYGGATYYRRVEPKQTNYYTMRGPVFLYSGQEAVLRQAIDADRKAAPDAEPALTRRLRQVGAEGAALALWVNPRAFDAGLEDKAAKAVGADAAFQKRLMTYWKALDGAAVWVNLDDAFHLSLAELVRPEDLPPDVRRFLDAGSKPSDLWRYFPDDALIACGFRLDSAALLDLLQSLQVADDKGVAAADAVFVRALVKDMLSHIGPDWGFCVTAPAADSGDWAPQVFLAVRAAPGGDDAPTDRALLSAVHTAALLGVLAYNHQHPNEPLRAKSAPCDGQEIHYVTGEAVLPPGVAPAYALVNGFLAFGSSPDAIRRFAATTPKSAAEDGAAFPLLRVSIKGWREYLSRRRDALAQALAAKNQATVDETRKRLDDLIGALQFVDCLEIDRRNGPGLAVVTLTVQTARPLKKAAD